MSVIIKYLKHLYNLTYKYWLPIYYCIWEK